MPFIDFMAGGTLASRLVTSGASTFSSLTHPMRTVMGATMSPYLTGMDLDEYARDPNYIFDPSYQKASAESLVHSAANAPRSILGKYIKGYSAIVGTSAITRMMLNGTTKVPLTPVGLGWIFKGLRKAGTGKNVFTRSLLGARNWLAGAAATTAMTGSPIAGVFLGGLGGRFFTGNYFGGVKGGKDVLKPGGILGLVSRLTGKRPEEVAGGVKNFITGDLQPRYDLMRTNVRKYTATVKGRVPIEVPTGVMGPEAGRGYYSEAEESITKQFRGKVTKLRKAVYDGAVGKFGSLTVEGRAGLNRMIYDYMRQSKLGVKSILDQNALNQVTRNFSTDPWELLKSRNIKTGIKAPTRFALDDLNDFTERVLGRKFNNIQEVKAFSRATRLTPVQNVTTALGTVSAIGMGVQSNFVNAMTGGTLGRVFGLSPYIMAGKMLSPGFMTKLDMAVDAVNQKVDNLATQVGRTSFDRKGEVVREIKNKRKMTQLRKRLNIDTMAEDFKDARDVKVSITEIQKKHSYLKLKNKPHLSSRGIIARAGISSLASAMRMLYIVGGVKKAASYAVDTTINTLRNVASISRNIGRMEFGTGRTLDTQVASTERSRAIQAMQNVGISARSYLGQEASIMSNF